MSRYRRWALSGVLTAGVVLSPVAGAWAVVGRDACTMLQKADVEAAFFPRKFDSGKPGYAVKGSETRAAVSSCTYTSRGATINDMVTVNLAVRRAPNSALAITPEAVRASAVQRKARPVDVAGLGKGAYWVTIGSIAYPVFELNVFRGKREWLVFSSGARTLDKSVILAGLMKIAKATIAP